MKISFMRIFSKSKIYILPHPLSSHLLRHSGLGQVEKDFIINPATKHVIPAAAERGAGIQKKRCNYAKD
jgi:hypothetical protein